LVADFLTLHPSLEDGSGPSAPPAAKRSRQEDGDDGNRPEGSSILDADEEAQLAAAIKASLTETVESEATEDKIRATTVDTDDSYSALESFGNSDSASQTTTPRKSIDDSKTESPGMA